MTRTNTRRQLTLGELIDALKLVAPDARISIDRDGCHPQGVASYRGYYDELAISYSPAPSYAMEFVPKLEAAIDRVFEGYKGGSFRMTRATPVWVSQYGDCEDRAIMAVIQNQTYDVVLVTANPDDPYSDNCTRRGVGSLPSPP